MRSAFLTRATNEEYIWESIEVCIAQFEWQRERRREGCVKDQKRSVFGENARGSESDKPLDYMSMQRDNDEESVAHRIARANCEIKLEVRIRCAKIHRRSTHACAVTHARISSKLAELELFVEGDVDIAVRAITVGRDPSTGREYHVDCPIPV